MLSDSGSEVQFGDITKLGRFIADTKESKLMCRQIGVLPNFILRDKLEKKTIHAKLAFHVLLPNNSNNNN